MYVGNTGQVTTLTLAMKKSTVNFISKHHYDGRMPANI
jgi:hypothetical protein